MLCDVEVALIVFSPKGKLCEFSSSSYSKSMTKHLLMLQIKGIYHD